MRSLCPPDFGQKGVFPCLPPLVAWQKQPVELGRFLGIDLPVPLNYSNRSKAIDKILSSPSGRDVTSSCNTTSDRSLEKLLRKDFGPSTFFGSGFRIHGLILPLLNRLRLRSRRRRPVRRERCALGAASVNATGLVVKFDISSPPPPRRHTAWLRWTCCSRFSWVAGSSSHVRGRLVRAGRPQCRPNRSRRCAARN